MSHALVFGDVIVHAHGLTGANAHLRLCRCCLESVFGRHLVAAEPIAAIASRLAAKAFGGR